MKKSPVIIVIFLSVILTAAIIMSGCTSSSDTSRIGDGDICQIMDYGNGVYYFPCVGAQFGNTISTWRDNNKNLTAVSITGDGIGAYGSDAGYWVMVE